MKTGAAKAEIIFPDTFFPTEGFSNICGPLFVRAAVLQSNMDFAVLSVEMTSLPPDAIEALKKTVSEETGVPQQNCWICVTHTFSAPHILPDAALTTDEAREKCETLKNSLHTAAKKAARAAKETLQKADIQFGQSACDANRNRDVETPDGWWIGNSGTGASDKTISAIRADGKDGNPIAILAHYAVQSSVLDGSILPDGGKAVSGDLAGMACMELEKQYPGATVIFLLGAAGDQAPVYKSKTMVQNGSGEYIEHDDGDAGIPKCRELSMTLAEGMKQAAEAAKPMDGEINISVTKVTVPAKKMNRNIHELKPTRNCEYIPDGKTQIGIEAVQIGTIALLGVKPELNCVTARAIAEVSPFAATLITTMVNGGAKYMADADSYDRYTYEAMNSPFGKGAAEILATEAVGLLHSLHTK